jgi:hypothetical protein
MWPIKVGSHGTRAFTREAERAGRVGAATHAGNTRIWRGGPLGIPKALLGATKAATRPAIVGDSSVMEPEGDQTL